MSFITFMKVTQGMLTFMTNIVFASKSVNAHVIKTFSYIY